MYNGTMFRDQKYKLKQGLNIYTDDDSALIIRLYIVIQLIASMWKYYYNLFIRVKDEIMVISAYIAVF